ASKMDAMLVWFASETMGEGHGSWGICCAVYLLCETRNLEPVFPRHGRGTADETQNLEPKNKYLYRLHGVQIIGFTFV
ncbi:MAG TPA: hypothetical protein PLL53_20385, partial [Saprospiraceae bacterium]|nr:hypothetical protein [Saprospiraceae bacterium]